MITQCPYCQYRYPDEPLSIDILKILSKTDLPTEDYILLIDRLVRGHGLSSYRGVKVHIGLKHKGEYNSPTFTLDDKEKSIINCREFAGKIHEQS